MGLNSQIDMVAAEAYLRSHDLEALFTQALGWAADAGAQTVQHLQQTCVPIARCHQVVAWKVVLAPNFNVTSAVRQRLYRALAAGSSAWPLMILVAAGQRRSLWCQAVGPLAREPVRQDSAVYVAGQPLGVWAFRLRRLAAIAAMEADGAGARRTDGLSASGLAGAEPPLGESPMGESPAVGLLPSAVEPGQAKANYDTVVGLLARLEQAIAGIDHVRDRGAYAWLTLKRLMLLQQVQQKGWLNNDGWYLQTRFGESLQQGENLFFKTVFQPLCRGVSLPAVERPLALQQSLGTVPFLGQLFYVHPLEEKYSGIAIADDPFEESLGWLSEQSSTDALNPWLGNGLSEVLGRYCQAQKLAQNEPLTSDSASLVQVCEQTLDQRLLSQVLRGKQAGDRFEVTLNDLLFNADTRLCRNLIQDILPALRIVDPACGSGAFLGAFYQRLTEIFCVLNGYIQQTQSDQLKIWQAGVAREVAPGSEAKGAAAQLLEIIQRRILKNNLYGVDRAADIVETAHFYLLSHLVATMAQPPVWEPLPDLSFNMMPGNALVGFITVDEARFDLINQAGAGSVLQGNLLQPLAADSYQTILAEKNLILEHFRVRNQLMAETRSVPAYARDALLREEMVLLDEKAQRKLDALLLNYMGQQLGIQYKMSRLESKPKRRSLTEQDMAALRPFHWGYHFNQIIKQGGFDIVVCWPERASVRPTTTEFVQRFPELCAEKGVTSKSLKTSKAYLAKADPDIAQAWLAYQSEYALLADYVYRSEQYGHQHPADKGTAARYGLGRDRLFVERCFGLLKAQGVGAVVVPAPLSAVPKAQVLREFLQENGTYAEAPVGGADEAVAMVTVWKGAANGG